jgi:hypothetical protein
MKFKNNSCLTSEGKFKNCKKKIRIISSITLIYSNSCAFASTHIIIMHSLLSILIGQELKKHNYMEITLPTHNVLSAS